MDRIQDELRTRLRQAGLPDDPATVVGRKIMVVFSHHKRDTHYDYRFITTILGVLVCKNGVQPGELRIAIALSDFLDLSIPHLVYKAGWEVGVRYYSHAAFQNIYTTCKAELILL